MLYSTANNFLDPVSTLVDTPAIYHAILVEMSNNFKKRIK